MTRTIFRIRIHLLVLLLFLGGIWVACVPLGGTSGEKKEIPQAQPEPQTQPTGTEKTEAKPPEPEETEKMVKLVPPEEGDLLPGVDRESPFGQALNLYSRGQFRAAEEILRVYLSQNPKDPQLPKSYYLIGNIQYRLKRFEEARQNYATILERYPDSPIFQDAQIQMGACKFQLGDLTGALEIFDSVLSRVKKDNQLARIYFYKGEIAYRGSNYLDAILNFTHFLDRSMEPTMVDLAKKKIDRTIRRGMAAEDLWQVSEAFPGRYPADEALVQLCEMYSQNRDQKNLVRSVEELKKRFPAHPALEKYLARLREQGVPEASGIPMKVGCVVPLTGPEASTGQKILQGIQLAFSQNRDLMEDKNIRLIIKNSTGTPQQVRDVVQELAEDPEMVAILGPMYSETAQEALPLADEYKIPFLTPSAANEDLIGKSRYFFRNALTNRMQGRVLAEFAYVKLGLRRFGLLYPNDGAGDELMKSFSSRFTELGGTVVHDQTYDPQTQTDFGDQIRALGGMRDDDVKQEVLKTVRESSSQTQEEANDLLVRRHKHALSIPQIKKAGGFPLTSHNFSARLLLGYDALLIPGSYDKVGLILPELAFYNISGIRILGGNGLNSDEFSRIGEQFAEGVIFTDDFFPRSDDPKVREFVQNYQVAFGDDPAALSARAFDAANILLTQIRAGFTTREGIRGALGQVQNFQGVTGETSIGANGESEKELTILTVRKGKIVEWVSEEKNLPDNLEEESVPASTSPEGIEAGTPP